MVVKIRSNEHQPPFGDTFSGDDLPAIPAHVLNRHQAKRRQPSQPERGTVYRTKYLLVPPEVRGRGDERGQAVNDILARLAVTLQPAGDQFAGATPAGEYARFEVVGTSDDTPPADAWDVVRQIREAGADPRSPVDAVDANQYAHEHLMFATASFGGTPWDSHNLPGGGSYSRSGGDGPVPVTLVLARPKRRAADSDPASESDNEPDKLRRRPVIAVLDTGIAPHPWFGIEKRGEAPTDNLLKVELALQDAVGTELLADQPTTANLPGCWDDPIKVLPLIGQNERAAGHSTFIAGLIRQHAPDADILPVRVMHSDGVAYEGDVLRALNLLVSRVQGAYEKDDPDLMIDIVTLSMGYYDEGDGSDTYTVQLKDVIDQLTELGVTVVAAAGNDASTRPFYPAALARENDLLLAVGALNPNETKAVFSNEAGWVEWWATGAGLVSTYPNDIRGPRSPEIVVTPLGIEGETRREGADEDDFLSGFAIWAGTSFAVPQVAAAVARGLIAGTEQEPALPLEIMSKAAARQRAETAVEWVRSHADRVT